MARMVLFDRDSYNKTRLRSTHAHGMVLPDRDGGGGGGKGSITAGLGWYGFMREMSDEAETCATYNTRRRTIKSALGRGDSVLS